MSVLEYLMTEPMPLRRAVKHLLARTEIGSFSFRYRLEAVRRMHYAYILLEGARLASKLGLERISALEFGVAGGTGLRWMERHAAEIEKLYPVRIDIYGFDTGGGLPPPKDYRDLPYHWQEGFFAMDRPALERSLSRAKLVFGDVADTCRTFFERFDPAPIAAVAHDLDFYSSTRDALSLFTQDSRFLLPRLFCYFDDTIGTHRELYNDFTGERLAIAEFNNEVEHRKIAVPHYLRACEGLGSWRHQIWVCHSFDHPQYNQFTSDENQQLPLSL